MIVVAGRADHVIIRNCEVKSKTVTWNENHNCIRIEWADYVTVQNNKLYDCKSTASAENGGVPIMAYYADHLTIEHNEIFNSHSGIWLKGGDSDSATVRFNLIYDGTREGIIVGPGLSSSPNNKVYQNVIMGFPSGIAFYGWTYSPVVLVVNNTIVDCNVGVYGRGMREWGSGTKFFNNIVTNINDKVMDFSDVGYDSDISWEHNVYQNYNSFAQFDRSYTFETWRSQRYQDSANPGSIISDPLYLSTASSDFRLQPNSPARNLGVDILDLDNDGRTTDIIPAGAYIVGNEIIGIDSGENLDAPRGLAAPTGLRIIEQ
jgi:nitrous oxidase accessory protein NosD